MLLQLKEEYQKQSGNKWSPDIIKKVSAPTTTAAPTNTTSSYSSDVLIKIDQQGTKVRDLKAAKASKVKFAFMYLLFIFYFFSN